MPNAITSYATLPNYGSTACALINNYLYVTGEFNTHMVRVNLDTGDVSNSWLSETQGFHKQYYYPYAIAADSQYVYSIRPYAYEGIHISKTPYDNPTGGDPNWVKNDTTTGSYFSAACHYNGNIYLGNGIGKIYRVDTTSKANTLLYTTSHGGITSIVGYDGFLYYVGGSPRGLYKVSITNPAAGSAQSVTNSGFWGSSQILNGLTVYNSDLFVSFQGANAIGQLDLTNPTTKFNTTFSDNSTTYIDGPTGIVPYNGNLYIVSYSFGKSKKILAKVAIPTLYVIPSAPKNILIDTGNTYLVSSGNVQVSIIDASNAANPTTFYWYSTNEGTTYTKTNATPSGSAGITTRFYIPGLPIGPNTIYVYAKNDVGNSAPVNTTVTVFTAPNPITNCSVSSIGSGNINVSITETSPLQDYDLNGVSYLYYLYTTGDNQSTNATAYTFGANLQSTSYTTTFVLNNQPANNYRVYLIAQNFLGNTVTNAFSANVAVFTPPINSITIDTGNTKTVASGNLQVRINDPSNIGLNNVYYYYSVNYDTDASFANTFVKANVSPYTFFIPSIVDISNTIYVRASNLLGNTSPSANLQVIVYQTPRSPPQVTFELVQSGNVRVTIQETAPIPDYYLNNVSYFLYAYNNTVGGNNLSGNTSTLIYNVPVGILSNTNSSYDNVVSYVNTGLTANTYTMYVISRNNVGNSNPVYANIDVYTTPLSPSSIDTGNTKSTTSGNLTVSINDTVNNSLNGIYYLYSLDGTNYGNSGVFRGANTQTRFTVSDTGNAQVPLVANAYTLYIAAANPVGNTVLTPITTSVVVYATPVAPVIDIGNTKSTTSGNLTVSITDALNSSTNGIYYLYSIDNIIYGNSGVATTAGNTSYTFTINNTGNALIPLVGQTYTLYVRASNIIGNTTSTPYTVPVYTTPLPPSIDTGNTKSTTSGNLTVTFNDTTNTPLNNINYVYFVYDSTVDLYY